MRYILVCNLPTLIRSVFHPCLSRESTRRGRSFSETSSDLFFTTSASLSRDLKRQYAWHAILAVSEPALTIEEHGKPCDLSFLFGAVTNRATDGARGGARLDESLLSRAE